MLLLFSFSLSWHLDQCHFTDGIALVGLFPVSSPTNCFLFSVMGVAIWYYPLGQLQCVSIRSVALPLDTFVAP